VVMKALARAPENRWATAREFALAIENAIGLTPAGAVGAWVEETAMVALRKKEELLAGVESHPGLSRETPSVDDVISTPRPTAFSRATTDAPPESGSHEETTLASSDTTKKAPARRRGLMLVAAFVAAAGLLVAAAFRGLNQEHEEASAPETPTAPTTIETAAPEATEVQTAEPEHKIEPSASSPRQPWRPPRTKAVASSKTPPANTGPPQPKTKESCDPPYWVDEHGIQRLKPQCL
jgi:eukaryotic-like serine/threonine-protein kinase